LEDGALLASAPVSSAASGSSTSFSELLSSSSSGICCAVLGPFAVALALANAVAMWGWLKKVSVYKLIEAHKLKTPKPTTKELKHTSACQTILM